MRARTCGETKASPPSLHTPPLSPRRICVAGCKLKMPLRQTPLISPPRAHSPSYPRVRRPGLVVATGARAARGSPSPRTAAAGTPLFLSPPSLLLLLRLLLADSSRRILHVNNIQALFTVAAGRQGTHASCLQAGGGGGKASAQHLHTPAPPLRATAPPGGRSGTPGVSPRPRSTCAAPDTPARARGKPRKCRWARSPPPSAAPQGKKKTKNIPTTTKPAQQHPPSPCGVPARSEPPPRRPAAYPEVASCVQSPAEAAGRAPGSGAPSAPAAAARPAPRAAAEPAEPRGGVCV